ncbi:SDR family oxidoreductase [Streptomyces sp. MMS24-I2-30]|uniref:SDR family oxidoreductase n=1 Tax=Streptomyces sp. MMS24-I2-30 TaxID=3351564 RepID=UPI003896B981
MGGLTGAVVHVVDGGSGLARDVVTRLHACGIEAVEGGSLSGASAVVLLGGMAPVETPQDALTVMREVFTAGQEVAAVMATHGGLFAVVQDTGGDFGLSGEHGDRAWLGGIAALARTAAREWPAACVKAIDCARGTRDSAAVAEAIVAELVSGGPALNVGLPLDGRRVTLDSVVAPHGAELADAPLDEDSVVVVTGGARGVTPTVLAELAARYRPRLAILGRTELVEEPPGLEDALDQPALVARLASRDPGSGPVAIRAQARRILAVREVRRTLAAVRAGGSEVRYFPVDVTDAASVHRVLDEVREVFGPLTGLIHAAGVVHDKYIADKTAVQYEAVLATKLNGLRLLLDATRDDPLRLLCLFSSIAAWAGNPGQSDYAMANEVLGQIAAVERVRRPHCLVRSIGWGPWDGGMVTPEIAARFGQQGLDLIPLRSGAGAFVAELRNGRGPAHVLLTVGELPDPPALRAETPVADETGQPHGAGGLRFPVGLQPMAMAVELFTAAARGRAPDQPIVTLRDIALDPPGAAAPPDDRGSVRIEGFPRGDRLELRLLGAPSRVEAVARLGGTPGGGVWPDHPYLPPLDGGEDGGEDRGDVVSRGAVLRMPVAGVRIGAPGAVALLELGGTGAPGDVPHLEAMAADAALRLAALWGEKELGFPVAPVGLGEYRRHRFGPAGRTLHCLLHSREQAGKRAVCDIALLREDQTLYAEFLGVALNPCT